ncbi:MAG: hypothetical protein IJ438_01515 [Clostridia bacterium]|nr:hypothetical protein [Clostridia bacterium]
MCVSPEQDSMNARIPEGQRMLVYIALTLLAKILLSLLTTYLYRFTIDEGAFTAFMTAGQSAAAISYGMGFVECITLTLLHRRVVFRSRLHVLAVLGAMFGASAVWSLLRNGALLLLGLQGAEVMQMSSYILTAAWIIISYFFQRWVLYRRSVDTL